jgi:hypothetical protein
MSSVLVAIEMKVSFYLSSCLHDEYLTNTKGGKNENKDHKEKK